MRARGLSCGCSSLSSHTAFQNGTGVLAAGGSTACRSRVSRLVRGVVVGGRPAAETSGAWPDVAWRGQGPGRRTSPYMNDMCGWSTIDVRLTDHHLRPPLAGGSGPCVQAAEGIGVAARGRPGGCSSLGTISKGHVRYRTPPCRRFCAQAGLRGRVYRVLEQSRHCGVSRDGRDRQPIRQAATS
jgi:hypothetical protein